MILSETLPLRGRYTTVYRRTQTQTHVYQLSRGFSFTWSVSRAPSLPPAVIGWRGDNFLLRRRENARGPRDAFGNRAWPDPRGHRKGPARSVRGSHRRWEERVIEEGVLWSRGLATLLLQPALAPEVLVHVEREALVLDLRAARTEGPHGAGRRPTAGEPRAVGPPADSRRARAAAECCVGLARTAALCGARQPEAEAPDHGAVARIACVWLGMAGAVSHEAERLACALRVRRPRDATATS